MVLFFEIKLYGFKVFLIRNLISFCCWVLADDHLLIQDHKHGWQLNCKWKPRDVGGVSE